MCVDICGICQRPEPCRACPVLGREGIVSTSTVLRCNLKLNQLSKRCAAINYDNPSLAAKLIGWSFIDARRAGEWVSHLGGHLAVSWVDRGFRRS